MTKVKANSETPLPAPARFEDWQAPTGRYITRGQTCKIHGQRGRWKFLAYVEPARGEPHVEVIEARKNACGVRCFTPDQVHGVSTADPIE